MAQSSGESSRETAWQDDMESLNALGRRLYDQRTFTDVTFLMGTKQDEIKAHKIILVSKSPVFEAMFYGPLQEQSTIKLPDDDPDAFEIMLEFAYKNLKPVFTADNVMPVFSLAHKYQVARLKRLCGDFAISLLKQYEEPKHPLSMDTLWEFLVYGTIYEEETLLNHCYGLIDTNSASFFNWLPATEEEIPIGYLANVVRRDTLNCPEYLIYNSLVWYAQKECRRGGIDPSAGNCRKILGEIFLLIRFPQMTVDEIRKGPRSSGFLNDKELLDLLFYMTNVEGVEVPYPKEPRAWREMKTHEVIRRSKGQLVFCVKSSLIDAAIEGSGWVTTPQYGKYMSPGQRRAQEEEAVAKCLRETRLYNM